MSDPATVVDGALNSVTTALETPVDKAAEGLVSKVSTDPAVLADVDAVVHGVFRLAAALLAPLAVKALAYLFSKLAPAPAK